MIGSDHCKWQDAATNNANHPGIRTLLKFALWGPSLKKFLTESSDRASTTDNTRAGKILGGASSLSALLHQRNEVGGKDSL